MKFRGGGSTSVEPETMFTIERSWIIQGRGELAGRSEAAARRLSGPVARQLLLYLQFGAPTDEGVIDDAVPLVQEALEVAAAHPDNARSRLYAHYMAGANHWAAGRIPLAVEHLAECHSSAVPCTSTVRASVTSLKYYEHVVVRHRFTPESQVPLDDQN